MRGVPRLCARSCAGVQSRKSEIHFSHPSILVISTEAMDGFFVRREVESPLYFRRMPGCLIHTRFFAHGCESTIYSSHHSAPHIWRAMSTTGSPVSALAGAEMWAIARSAIRLQKKRCFPPAKRSHTDGVTSLPKTQAKAKPPGTLNRKTRKNRHKAGLFSG